MQLMSMDISRVLWSIDGQKGVGLQTVWGASEVCHQKVVWAISSQLSLSGPCWSDPRVGEYDGGER